MRKKFAWILLTLLLAAVFTSAAVYREYFQPKNAGEQTDFHVGVSFCGNTTSEAKLLVDRVKGYTNLFVVQSGPISVNETAMNEIVDYAVSSNLDVIVYFGFFNPQYPWQLPWLEYAKQQWGNHFLGIYLNDEPGGSTIDANWTGYFNQIKIRNSSDYYLHIPTIDLAINRTLPPDYDQAAFHFNDAVEFDLGLQELKNRSITAYTSDYALYWFDYIGGYDTLFAEFGSNHSIAQDVALARGAARLQNKTWGVIVTWKYTQPPYLDSASEIYRQILNAYFSGAKYVVIFDYPQIPGNPYGVLTDEHFEALEQFWQVTRNVKVTEELVGEAVLVLPKNYGWGMRNPNDNIWGFWGPDEKSPAIWNISRELLARYGFDLDIVYQDERFPFTGRYRQIYFWNQTL